MTHKRGRKRFEDSENMYRAFLTKFTDNPNFTDPDIGEAVDYAYKTVYKLNGLVNMNIKTRLFEIILFNRAKILHDLETLKKDPKAIIEILEPIDSLELEKQNKQVKKSSFNGKRQINDDLDNKANKKLKLNTSDDNKKNKTNTSKEINSTNTESGSLLKYLTIEKPKPIETPPPINTIKLPVVVIENNIELDEMAKNLHNKSKNEDVYSDMDGGSEYQSINEGSDKADHQYLTDSEINGDSSLTSEFYDYNSHSSLQNLSYESHTHRDFNINNESDTNFSSYSCARTQVFNNFLSNENTDYNTEHLPSNTYIKQEMLDDLDMAENLNLNVAKPQNFIKETESQVTENQLHSSGFQISSEYTQVVTNSCSPTLITNQDNVASMKVAYCNNFIPVTYMNYPNAIQNSMYMPNMNCGPYAIVPVPLVSPNVIVMNAYNGINGFHGMCNTVINPLVQNHNYGTLPDQAIVNQMLNPVQEIVKLQSTITTLNTQLASLGNALVAQTDSSQST